MKKCPTCGKEFEDSMRFCQVDGAELAAAEPAFDPYATVVGHKLDLTQDEPAETPVTESSASVEQAPVEISVSPAADAEPIIHETTGSIPIAEPEEVLELPGSDPLKTMYVSESELKDVFGVEEEAKNAEIAPPPSPFSVPESVTEEPASPPFAEQATMIQPAVSPSFQEPEPAPVAEWTPPPAPDAAWQNQQIGSNTPFQPPPAGVAGESKGLAIGSLVCGVLSCTIFCCMGIFLGPIAIILGFMAKKKVDENPSEFGGRGLALAGMITGGVGLLFGIGFILYEVLMGGLALLLGSMPN